ncbi:hypothetical protein ACHHYP_16583 [Achlya hypogyna]|uniref:Uncharacterized protein n=1 Tax=Achlya hypogyna TaxID=1202772 RepID=A0A1V9ZDY6_ACHHY|nr:hypothetical protein ACHHYP_16583 [Achlya hypogyna]
MLPTPTLMIYRAQREWTLCVKWPTDEGDDNMFIDVVGVTKYPLPGVRSIAELEDANAIVDSHAVRRAESCQTGTICSVEIALEPRSLRRRLVGYLVQLHTPTATSCFSKLLRRIEPQPDTTKDVVLAARRAGLGALHDLLLHYALEVQVAMRGAMAVAYILTHDAVNSDDSCSDDEEALAARPDVSDYDLILDVWQLLLRRMESYPEHVDLQRWCIQAGRALYLRLLAIAPEKQSSFQNTLTTFVTGLVKAADRFDSHHGLVLGACEALVELFRMQPALVGVVGDRGGIETVVAAMRLNRENLEVARACAQVLVLCCFADVTLQHAAKQEGLLPLCQALHGGADMAALGSESPLYDLLLCLQVILENCGRLSAANAALSRVSYSDGTTATIVCTDAVPNDVGGRRQQAAAMVITRFFRYLLSLRRMGPGSMSLLAVLQAVLARENRADRD